VVPDRAHFDSPGRREQAGDAEIDHGLYLLYGRQWRYMLPISAIERPKLSREV
jgi:hypothetical protein